MEQLIHTKSYAEPALSRREILRYMRCGSAGSEMDPLLDSCLSELLPQLVYKVCWRISDIGSAADPQAGSPLFDLGFIKTDSRDLRRNLQDCKKLVFFAATIGLAPDRLIAKYGRLSPSRALCMQAIGAERIESLCDAFCQEIAAQYAPAGYQTRPRFSPGYGDFPLEAQKAFFQALDCPRRIGLSLNDSLLMSPSKSVTALLGLFPSSPCTRHTDAASESQIGNALPHTSCASCAKTDCLFRTH